MSLVADTEGVEEGSSDGESVCLIGAAVGLLDGPSTPGSAAANTADELFLYDSVPSQSLPLPLPEVESSLRDLLLSSVDGTIIVNNCQ